MVNGDCEKGQTYYARLEDGTRRSVLRITVWNKVAGKTGKS